VNCSCRVEADDTESVDGLGAEGGEQDMVVDEVESVYRGGNDAVDE